MLEAVSCWKWDWTAIGAVATAATAVVAIVIPALGNCNRRRFAKFLLKKDLERLSQMLIVLGRLQTHLADWDSPRSQDRDFARDMYKHTEDEFSSLLSELEYFGKSDIQFGYRPKSTEFARLQAAVASLMRLSMRLVLQRDGLGPTIAHDFAKIHRTSLDKALNAWITVDNRWRMLVKSYPQPIVSE